MKNLNLKISGMHCGSCEKIIQMDLDDVDGVIEAEIDSKKGTGLVKVEDSVSSEVILKTINDAGYKAELVGAKIE